MTGTTNGNGNGHAARRTAAGNGHTHSLAATPMPVQTLATNRIAAEVASRPSSPPVAGALTTNGKHETAPAKKAETPRAPVEASTREESRRRHSTAKRSSHACMIWSASAPGIRRKRSASTSTSKPTWASIRSSGSKFSVLAESIEAGADGASNRNLEMEKLLGDQDPRAASPTTRRALSNEAAPAGDGRALRPTASTKPHRRAASSSRVGDLHPRCAGKATCNGSVVRLVDAPLPVRPTFAPPTGTIVITDDQLGSA